MRDPVEGLRHVGGIQLVDVVERELRICKPSAPLTVPSTRWCGRAITIAVRIAVGTAEEADANAYLGGRNARGNEAFHTAVDAERVSWPIAEQRTLMPRPIPSTPVPDRHIVHQVEAVHGLSLIHISEPTRPY